MRELAPEKLNDAYIQLTEQDLRGAVAKQASVPIGLNPLLGRGIATSRSPQKAFRQALAAGGIESGPAPPKLVPKPPPVRGKPSVFQVASHAPEEPALNSFGLTGSAVGTQLLAPLADGDEREGGRSDLAVERWRNGDAASLSRGASLSHASVARPKSVDPEGAMDSTLL